jgi:glucosamine--fructose-6-phosphate aminotransferase (isomerizing)
MCGIISILSKNNNIKNIIINGLEQLQNRGYDSAGITYFNKKFNTIKYASTNEIRAIEKLKYETKKIDKFNLGIGHTRWATHGAKTDNNSHPHHSFDNKVILVHNGIIENFDKLKNKIIKQKITFKSETDTEVIANLIAFHYQTNNFIDSIKITLDQLEGTWGLVIINTDTPNKLYCVRKGSPLLISQTEDFIMVSSELAGFNGLVSNYFILDGNDLCEMSLQDNKLELKTQQKYQLKDNNINNFNLSPDPFPHWTIKEIEEQYESSIRALSFGGRLLDENKVKLGGLEPYIQILKRIDNIIFLGCGTSYNAALIGSNYFKELCNFNSISVYDGADFKANDIPKIGNTALIFLSQSGETKDLHRCINIGKELDLFLIGVINVVDSMIAREVDCGVYLNAGREVGVASTKCFTSQVIVLSLISIWFSQIHNHNENQRKEYVESLRKLPNDIKNTIQVSKENKDKLVDIVNKDNLFILGKGISEYISYESALKIKEISYIHAEGYNGSSLKHGPFALLSEDFPVILISPNNIHYQKMLNVYQEIKSRNAPIIFITNVKTDIKNSLIIPNNKKFGDLLTIIPMQFLAYNLSIIKNINPDYPRNLAKSVVVE